VLYGGLWNPQKNIGRLSCKKSCWLYQYIYGNVVSDSIPAAGAILLGSHCCSLGSKYSILFLFAPVETERSRVKTEMLRIKRLRTRGFILCMDVSCGIVICLKIVPKELVCIIAGACLFQSMTVLVQTALNYKNNQKNGETICGRKCLKVC